MRVIFAFLLITTCAVAQNADEQSRFDARIGAQIGDLVVQNDKLVVQIGTLQSQLVSAQQRIKDLEAKLADAPNPSEESTSK